MFNADFVSVGSRNDVGNPNPGIFVVGHAMVRNVEPPNTFSWTASA